MLLVPEEHYRLLIPSTHREAAHAFYGALLSDSGATSPLSRSQGSVSVHDLNGEMPRRPPAVRLQTRAPWTVLLAHLNRLGLAPLRNPMPQARRRGLALAIREVVYLDGPMGERIEIGRWRHGPGALLGWYPSIQDVLAARRRAS